MDTQKKHGHFNNLFQNKLYLVNYRTASDIEAPRYITTCLCFEFSCHVASRVVTSRHVT